MLKAVLLCDVSTLPRPPSPPPPAPLARCHVEPGAFPPPFLHYNSPLLDEVLLQIMHAVPLAQLRALCPAELPPSTHHHALKMAYLAAAYGRARAFSTAASAPYALQSAVHKAKKTAADLTAAVASIRDAVVAYSVLLLAHPDFFVAEEEEAAAAAAGGGGSGSGSSSSGGGGGGSGGGRCVMGPGWIFL